MAEGQWECVANVVPCLRHGVPYVFAHQEVENLYSRAIQYFKSDAIIHVFAAQFHNIYRGNHRVEQIHLTEAEVPHCPPLIA